jgi:MoaA/NifB/PqqE/SkfB family radical SAM enzyme
MKISLKEAHIEVTHNCDLNCLICEHPFLSKQKTFLSKEKFIDFISSHALKNINLLSISGGEPTLHPDFNFFVKTAVKTLPNTKIILLTNLLSLKQIESALSNLKKSELARIHIGSSLDGPIKIHNNLRGNLKAFEKLSLNTKKLKEKFKNLSIGFTFTINRFNYKSIFETYIFSKKKLNSNLGFQLIIPTSHNKTAILKREFFPDIARELKLIINDILLTKAKEDLYSLPEISYLFSLFNYFHSGKKQKTNCNAGKDFLMISPEGAVYLCPLQKNIIFGNINNEEFDKIIKALGKKTMKHNLKICKKCFLRCSI